MKQRDCTVHVCSMSFRGYLNKLGGLPDATLDPHLITRLPPLLSYLEPFRFQELKSSLNNGRMSLPRRSIGFAPGPQPGNEFLIKNMQKL